MLNDARLREQHRTNVNSLIDELHELRAEPTWNQQHALHALKVTAAIQSLFAASGLGECQMAVPYSPLQPVIDPNGELRWCCQHNPRHCAS
jgi:hypothetical protein